MRICVISYHSSPLVPVGAGKSGGMSIVIRSLYERLGRHADVDIFTRGNERVVSVHPGVRVLHVGENNPGRFVEAIVKNHRRHGYDLMHTHYWSSGIVGLLASRVLKIPWVHTLHTVEVLKTIERDKARIEIEEEIMRSCDLVISPTSQEALAIQTLYPDVKTATIPHGVDTRRFAPSHNGHSNILFVGRIDPIKGIHLLIDAIRLTKRDIALTVVGGPSKGDHNLRSIEKHAAGLDVDFVGQVRHDRLADYYSRAAMLVVPSYYESFGLVGLEAMASARPVIGFSHTGLKETVGDDAGVLVKMGARNLARAIKNLAVDHNLRQRLGNRGRKKALAFDWSLVAQKYGRLYERVVEK
ncbi:MAG: glycosyltransferase [candidate division WOR-3 bacterium]|nr:MAG: glycosyltransferase [candidate division WOR-3 bacterium]